MTNAIRLRCSGQDHTLTLDLAQLMGDTLEELEEHIGGEGVIAWMQRLQRTFEVGIRIRDLRSRDIIAMIFLARSQVEPGTRWSDVSRSIAPYTLEVLPDEPVAPPAPPPTVRVSPDLEQQVAAPALAPTLDAAAARIAPDNAGRAAAVTSMWMANGT